MLLTSYRYPNEEWILAGTVLLVLAVAVLAAGVSFCLVPVFFLVFVLIAYWINRSNHNSLMQTGHPVSPERTPNLARIEQACLDRLKPGQVEVFIVRSSQLNAYTFGFSSPQDIVLYSSLLEVMDEDELRFVLGHEMGHVALGHTWLNTLLGGMAGVPVTLGAAVIVTLAFRWWNRACEYSADRAGLLACGKPQKAISALIKLVAGSLQSQAELQRALQLIEHQDDSVLNQLGETLSTHPMIARRIEQIRKYAATAEYATLQAYVSTNTK
ncbi:MAG: M48 family metallopeptidase [Anaerolineaceae bacterium]